jgi:hypothetical protein
MPQSNLSPLPRPAGLPRPTLWLLELGSRLTRVGLGLLHACFYGWQKFKLVATYFILRIFRIWLYLSENGAIILVYPGQSQQSAAVAISNDALIMNH